MDSERQDNGSTASSLPALSQVWQRHEQLTGKSCPCRELWQSCLLCQKSEVHVSAIIRALKTMIAQDSLFMCAEICCNLLLHLHSTANCKDTASHLPPKIAGL
eukprot:1981218-Amphidinium_carterae.2